MKLVLVVGAATKPGRLHNAVESLVAALAERRGDVAATIVNLATSPVAICDGRALDDYDAPTRATVAAIAGADAVLLAAPVYRASFPGVLKNLLDLLPVAALQDKPVGILAMGGSPHHYLGVDSHLRLVLAWFGAMTLPTSVYLTNRDFAEGKLASEGAASDLLALGEALASLAAALAGRRFGPSPLASRFT